MRSRGRFYPVEIPTHRIGRWRLPARTCHNVEDSDGTLIVNLGEVNGAGHWQLRLSPGRWTTHLVVQVDAGGTVEAAANVLVRLHEHASKMLNIGRPA